MAAVEVLPPSLSSFKPGSNEKEATGYLFKKADTEAIGVLTGDQAVPFFSHSSLPPALLGEIWQISDPDNSGFLTPERFGVACRLIGHAQAVGGGGTAASEVKEEWVATTGPFPKFEGFPIPSHLHPPPPPPLSSLSTPGSPAAAATIQRTNTGPLQPQGTGNSFTRNNIPRSPMNMSRAVQQGRPGFSITPEEKAKYATLFAHSSGGASMIDGDKARDIFIKSKLPLETLGRIWNLADTHSRGSLDVIDFTIGMHLIQHTMNGSLPSLPEVLAPALYASASGTSLDGSTTTTMNNNNNGNMAPAGSMGSPMRMNNVSSNLGGTPTRSMSPQSTGQQRFTAGSQFNSPAGPQASYQQLQQLQQQQQQQQQIPWLIDAREKVEADQYFEGLDPMRKGTIDGEAAVGFFSLSGLPVETLARVWDLADIRDTGALNKDEFAVALRLIRDRVAGKELPSSLPVELTPPSLRMSSSPTQNVPPSGPQRDLLDLTDDDGPGASTGFPPTATSAFSPMPTTSVFPPLSNQQQRSLSPQGTGTGHGSPSTYGLAGTIFPQSTGTSAPPPTLSPQGTGVFSGGGHVSSPRQTTQRSVVHAGDTAATTASPSFFDDNDDADKNAQLSSDQAKLKGLESEHKETSESVSQLTVKRGDLESSISATTTSINELHVKLSQARAAHETERKMVDDLEIRQKEQTTLLSRARSELITAESDLSRLRVERTEIEGNYLRDKENVRDLKKKMAEVAKETEGLKETLVKLQKEARQQKGLLAISKKQLATVEGEKEKTNTLIEEEKHAETQRQAEEVSNPHAATRSVDEFSPFDHSNTSTIAHTAVPTASLAATSVPASVALPTSPTSSIRSTNPFDRMGVLSKSVSPQQTGSTLPIHSFASGTPLTSPGPVAAGIDQEPAGISAIATPAVLAMGAGAVAAAGAIGAAMGFGGAKTSEHDKTPSKEEPEEAATTPVQSAAVEKDPFGVPTNNTIAEPQLSAVPSDSTDFDKGFGDDFASATPTSPTSLEKDTPVASSFDDFNSTLAGTQVVPSASAVEHSPLDKSSEEASEPVTEKVEEPIMSEPSVVPVADTPLEKAVVEGDSSDDEPVVEDAVGSHHISRASEATAPGLGASTSDSGESFVHVPSAGASAGDEGEKAVSALDSVHETPVDTSSSVEAIAPGVVKSDAPRESSPGSEGDLFEDAHASRDNTHLDGVPGAFPTSSSVLADSIPIPPVSTRRAAPPPPVTRNSLATSSSNIPAASAFDDAFAVPTVASAAAPNHGSGTPNFGDDFDDDFGSATITSAPTTAKAVTSDFDDAFSDFPPTAHAISATPTGISTAATQGSASGDFDNFDDEFSFKPDFNETSHETGLVGSGTAQSGFAGKNISAAHRSASPETTNHAFDDAFGGEPSFNPASGLVGGGGSGGALHGSGTAAAAAVSAAPLATRTLDDDRDGVKQIVGMGFSRTQAIDALEKYDWNVTRAVNSLLG